MKPGTTTITPPTIAGFPATVHVGSNERAVRVSFGAITIYLSNRGDPGTVIVRAEAHDTHGRSLPVQSRGTTDVRNQVEYTVEAQATPG